MISGPVTLEMDSTSEMGEPKCLIWLNLSKNPVHPQCVRRHYYCNSCLTHLPEKKNICPQCEKKGPLKGNQPIGIMTWTTETQRSLPGYQDCGIINVNFSLGNGIQGILRLDINN